MTLEAGSQIVYGAGLGSAVLSDLRERRVANALVLVTAGGGVAAQIARAGATGAASALVAGLATLLLLWAPWRRGHLGGGDVKLASAAALGVGLAALPHFLLAAALAGGALSLACLVASSAAERARVGANLAALRLGLDLPAPAAARGAPSVPYAAAIAVGAAFALAQGG